MKKRDKLGRFARVHHFWDGENWDDGYIARNRMRVYRPDYPNQVYMEGYVERAHVVWWLAHGIIPEETVVHHKDENTLNDKLDNLELMDRIKHTILHRLGKLVPRIILTCPSCEEGFEMLESVLRSRLKCGRKSFFCSRECFYESMRI